MKTRALLCVLILLILVTYCRFLSMAGLDFHLHLKVLSAYFYSENRAYIFLIQYLGIFYLSCECLSQTPPPSTRLATASALFLLVSLARYYLPIFLTSCLGDALVVWWFNSNKKKTSQFSAGKG